MLLEPNKANYLIAVFVAVAFMARLVGINPVRLTATNTAIE